MNPSKRKFALALTLLVGACDSKSPDAAPQTSRCFGGNNKFNGGNKSNGGVFVTDLAIVNIQQQPPGPEVLLVKLSPTVIDDEGRYKIPIAALSTTLDCLGNEACETFRSCFADERAVSVTRTCSAAFVGEQDIVTAAHCLKGRDWEHIYGVVGYQSNNDWPTDGDFMYVPADHMVRLCHVHECAYADHPGPDYARVHVCPVGSELVDHATLEFAGEPPKRGDSIVARTHALGLPAKAYRAKYVDDEPPSALFTNMGAGSGGVVLNREGALVGVIRGYIHHSKFMACTTSSRGCRNQRITWIDTISALPSDARCERVHGPRAHEHECGELTKAGPSPE